MKKLNSQSRLVLAITVCLLFTACVDGRDFLNFKAVSSGQSSSDAPVFTQILRGNSLLNQPVVNIRGVRNSAGDLYGSWLRRARVPSALATPSDVPLAEEAELYDVEVMNGSAVARTFRNIAPGDEQNAVLQSDKSASPYDGITGNTLTGTSTDSRYATGINAVSLQTIDGPDNYVAASLTGAVGPAGTSIYGVMDAAAPWETAGVTLQFFGSKNGNTANGSVGDGTDSATFTMANGERIYIYFGANQVRFYLNSMARGSVPVLVSSLLPTYPIRVHGFVSQNNSCLVSNIVLTNRQRPAFVYTAAQQTTDFGSTQSSITIRIYQLGRLGRGRVAVATI